MDFIRRDEVSSNGWRCRCSRAIMAQIRGRCWLQLTAGALTGRSASRRCGSVCGSAPSGAFQRHNLDLLLSLATSAVTALARDCPPSPTPARAAGRSIRPLCGSADRLSAHAGSCVILNVRRRKRGDGGGELGRDGRPLEATDIATTDDKMPTEEVLNDTS